MPQPPVSTAAPGAFTASIMAVDSGLYTLLGAALGAAVTGLVTLLSTRAQARLARISAERDLRRDELKAGSDRELQAAEHVHLVRGKLLDRALDRLEPAYTSLAAISRRSSLTGLTMHETAQRDVPAFDVLYEEQGLLLDSVTMALGLHAADLHLSTDALSAAMSRFWGSARARLRLWAAAAPGAPEHQRQMEVNERVLDAAEAVRREADTLRAGIRAAISARHAAALTNEAGRATLPTR